MSAGSWGRLGMCEARLGARGGGLAPPRLASLAVLLTQASVATWNRSRTLFSDCCAEHSMYTAEICLAMLDACEGGGNQVRGQGSGVKYNGGCSVWGDKEGISQ